MREIDTSAISIAASLQERIRQRACADSACPFVYAESDKSNKLFETPDEFLKSLYEEGVVKMKCAKFILACLALGMPADTCVDQREDSTLRVMDDEKLITPRECDQTMQWLHNVLPHARIAYIGDCLIFGSAQALIQPGIGSLYSTTIRQSAWCRRAWLCVLLTIGTLISIRGDGKQPNRPLATQGRCARQNFYSLSATV